MLELLLLLVIGFFRAAYVAFLNGGILWLILQALSSITLIEPLGYFVCVFIAFVPGFIIACISLYKQTR